MLETPEWLVAEPVRPVKALDEPARELELPLTPEDPMAEPLLATIDEPEELPSMLLSFCDREEPAPEKPPKVPADEEPEDGALKPEDAPKP